MLETPQNPPHNSSNEAQDENVPSRQCPRFSRSGKILRFDFMPEAATPATFGETFSFTFSTLPGEGPFRADGTPLAMDEQEFIQMQPTSMGDWLYQDAIASAPEHTTRFVYSPTPQADTADPAAKQPAT